MFIINNLFQGLVGLAGMDPMSKHESRSEVRSGHYHEVDVIFLIHKSDADVLSDI